MKKLISLILALVMVFALVACAPAADNDNDTKDPVEDNGDNDGQNGGAGIDSIEIGTIISLFQDMTDENLGLSYCDRKPITAENAGLEMGYYEFAGEFEEAMALAPSMLAQPFILIVYRLAEGADTAAFAADIEENADLFKWVCVNADKAFTKVSGRTVLFVMCTEELVQPIEECFTAMCADGFKAEDYVKDPLADKTAQSFYDEFYSMFRVEDYGFLDGADVTTLTADTAYGLGALDLSKIEASVFDDGYVPATEATDEMPAEDEKSYVFALIQMKEGESAKEFAQSIKAVFDMSGMKGEEPAFFVTYGSDFVMLYAGAGFYNISVISVPSFLSVNYRMSAV